MISINATIKKGFEDLGLPVYKTEGSGAADLKAAIEKAITIAPGETALIPTGIFVEIPEGHIMHITPRSGFALKNSISIVNSPGIIDSDYRGEVGVILINHGKEPFTVNRGDRIAQMTILQIKTANFMLIKELSETPRGAGGYGHTGHK
ncbi:MAG: dUTP diphosphatase [Nanoarchaeota archaeon]|nr:dUTP diphosphatase [Nanoarchaeota archaeon]MBU1270393.1 dUTP diphosphatase [Nanoarchaeota archaeon]MBU1604824.1 dUTP diphosphatase [Nanoarchaeota archaeon]MBU2442807.1 dUTP diphosphatase [Nanoarchaeota archaeon]